MEYRINSMVEYLRDKIVKEAVEGSRKEINAKLLEAGPVNRKGNKKQDQNESTLVKTVISGLQAIKDQLKTLNRSLQTVNLGKSYNESNLISSYKQKTQRKPPYRKVPAHLDDHAMRLVMNLDNPQQLAQSHELQSRGTRSGSKRRSFYDEVYQKTEKRYEVFVFLSKQLGKSMRLKRAKSKISNLIKSDKQGKKAPRRNPTQRLWNIINNNSNFSESN